MKGLTWYHVNARTLPNPIHPCSPPHHLLPSVAAALAACPSCGFSGDEPQSVCSLALTSRTQRFVHGVHLLCWAWQFDDCLYSTTYLAIPRLDVVWSASGPYFLCINKTFLCILLNIGIITDGEVLSRRPYEFYLNRDCLTIFQSGPTLSTTPPPEAGGSVGH